MTKVKNNNIDPRSLTRKDLMTVFFRQFFLQCSLNYERIQTGGYIFTILPALRKLYANDPDGLKSAVKRNLTFFNAQPYMAAPIFGLALSMEERLAIHKDIDPNSISSMKVGLMGPFAGLGDSLFWFTILPICLSIGISLSTGGNIIGPIVFLVIFNVFHLSTRYFGVMKSYELGSNFIEEMAKGGLVQRITDAASILGLMVVGVMIKEYISVPFTFSIGQGAAAQSFISVVNTIMPNLLALGLTFAVVYMLRKRITPIRIMLIILVVCLVGAYFKVLGV